MASASAITPDTPITLKVNYEGVTRRFKLPLRDLGATTLEDKLRAFLQIPVGTKTVFERYSDSAATYVVLEPSNISVYKQLYRAAKAKQKLKLRVSTSTEQEEGNGPRPVTVEDEEELPIQQSEPLKETVTASDETASTPAFQTTVPCTLRTADTMVAPQAPADFPAFIREWRTRGMPRIHLRRDADGVEVIDFLGDALVSPSDPLVSLAPVASQQADKSQYVFSQTASRLSFAELIRQAQRTEPAAPIQETVVPAPAPVPAPASLDTAVPVEEKSADQDESCHSYAGRIRRPFTVCCNSCDRAVPDAHFHCSTCDDGDFDLCQDCVNQGITCYDDKHWLIKRTIKNGQITNSTTHVAPKTSRSSLSSSSSVKTIPVMPVFSLPIRTAAEKVSVTPTWNPTSYSARTCNGCVRELPEQEFLHCTVCEDFDLCKVCFAKDAHGHHPKHPFTPAVKGTVFESPVTTRLAAGRNAIHNAICDGCDKYIRGVRHKCLDCPDWDYCSDCVQNASFIHPEHRFAAMYEPLTERSFRTLNRAVHTGICCDGPLCSSSRSAPRYIVGERYKCAVCHDTDFCAGCEASPANTHNKTHPLIKFKTPVRHVSVTTTGEHEDGRGMPSMGDRIRRQRTSSRSTETIPSPAETIAVNPVQTVVDVKPEPHTVEPVTAELAESVAADVPTSELVAIFKHDTVEDGTIFPPNHTFEQTWVLRNEGQGPWPAGCSVKFVSGDRMSAIDPTHPVSVHELVSASQSTVCYNQLQPGQEFPFTVLLRTPTQEGKAVSHWRLHGPDGKEFGHQLWCHVEVVAPVAKPVVDVKVQHRDAKEGHLLDASVPEMARSQMIIPKLEHESPASSIHVPAESEPEVSTETDTLAPSVQDHEEEEFEDCAEDDEWAEESDDGFMTDEEYDILDASDEEYLSEQHKMVSKK